MLQVAARFSHKCLHRLIQADVVQVLPDQSNDLLVGLVQLHATVAGILPIVLPIDDATAAAVVVHKEAIVFGVVTVGGSAAAGRILIADTDSCALIIAAGCDVLGTAPGISG